MYHYIVNKNVSGKISNPLFYDNCKFQPGAVVQNGYIINPVTKLQNITLRNCFVDNAYVEGSKLQGYISMVRSTVYNCNMSRLVEPSFNDCVLFYNGKHQYAVPILNGTFNGCSLTGQKIIEPVIKNSISTQDSLIIFDDETILSPSKGANWNFINTDIINAEIDY